MVNLGGATENDRKKIVITKDSKAFFHNNVCLLYTSHLLRVLFSKLREGTQNESPGIHDHELVALHKMIYNNPSQRRRVSPDRQWWLACH